ncbi:dienelactone hydrolase family protein [Oryzihumus sp.]|uniref:dienelactone hydrolase family protein n=1 Tax=Oryzihumus sp. TaxID=1968903 RepID=UPI002EDB1A97
MATVSIPTAEGALPAWLATPAGPGAWPGVVVVSDVMGMTADLQRQADWLAGEGFLAVAPDLFHWGSRARCLRSILRETIDHQGRTYRDLAAARSWLTGRQDCTGRVGVVGFCMGGGFALMLALGDDYDVAGVNYGTASRRYQTREALDGACPVVGSFGRRDLITRRSAERLEYHLGALGIDHDIRIYPGVGHGFMNDHRDSGGMATFLGKVSGTAYDEPATRDARRRIAAFFHRHLDPAADTA